ncbi:MAG: hypothetical protein ACTS5P_00250 [Candidatus Hodgkinia cicadicola]
MQFTSKRTSSLVMRLRPHFVRLTLEIKVNIKINNNTGSETEENEELRLRNYD